MFVCHDCIEEEYLSKEVLDSGNSARCSFCDEVSASIGLEELAEKVHEVIKNYFYQTSSEPEGYEYLLAKEGLWDREGELVSDLINGIAMVDPEISESIREYLSWRYDAAGKDALYEEQPYEPEAQYAEREVDTLDFAESWSAFKQSIRTQSRFFNPHAKEVLEHIFRNLSSQVTIDGEPVVRSMQPDADGCDIYRARIAFSMNALEKIIRELPRSLAAPPHKHAKSGRMNAGGISVFYGAMDIDTCIAEVRAPVSSYVVIAKFRPVRPIKVLDLNRLQKIYVEGSYFDPNHIVELSRARFLECLVDELSSPVLPGSEEREYLPTQVVAEYLAQLDGLNLDGVIFNSSQVSGDGQNIVLFNHAGCVESYELPEGTEIEVFFGHDYSGDDTSVTVWEMVPQEKEEKNQSSILEPIFSSSFDYNLELPNSDDCPHEPTLRIEMESVKVHKVQGVEYKCSSMDVRRHRMVKKDHEEF